MPVTLTWHSKLFSAGIGRSLHRRYHLRFLFFVPYGRGRAPHRPPRPLPREPPRRIFSRAAHPSVGHAAGPSRADLLAARVRPSYPTPYPTAPCLAPSRGSGGRATAFAPNRARAGDGSASPPRLRMQPGCRPAGAPRQGPPMMAL